MSLNHPSVTKIMFIYGFFLLACIFAVHINGTNFKEEKGILQLSDSNLDAAKETFPQLVLYFYSPTCGHCKQFTPELEKAAEQLAQAKSPIRFAKIDATAEQ